MNWQDWVFSIGSWIFALSFVPSFRKKQYPAVGTSLMTGSVLAVFMLAYISLGLHLTAISNLITTSCWFTMAWFKFLQNRGAEEKVR